ncbi:MAG: HD-GYP domain-containing protein [Planctomycetota bacterium]|jgi:putative nucleotidyltransferase with HDIG domain
MDWAAVIALPGVAWAGLVSLVVLGLFSEYSALNIEVGKALSTSSITFILIFASVILFGPEATTLFAGSSWFISQFVLRRKALAKAVFNVSQIVVSASLAGATFIALGGESAPDRFVFSLSSFIGFGAAFIVANLLFVSAAMALIEGIPFRQVVPRLAGPKGSHIAYDLLVSPVALLVAVLFIEFQVWGLFGVALTLFFIRRSYLTNYQLQQALRDLLKVLVKAIETRDPYTSGHSLRVSVLARRIAVEMALPTRRVEEIETAALLHDIGKIDEVYTDLLKKPAELSAEERTIIESHATKGADLLRSLSSVSEDVIGAVKYHHERVDGKGYPDGLKGQDIPLGARIIKVCDAVDAMLSDRPYRAALKLSAVREQLLMHSGTQFDAAVVVVVINGSLLEEHEAELAPKRLRKKDLEGDLAYPLLDKAGQVTEALRA